MCMTVAILVIMEDVFLRNTYNYHYPKSFVAILVIMEDVFLQDFKIEINNWRNSRNPCYNGRCISTPAGEWIGS